MLTVTAFESDGVALGVLTVTAPVPVAARAAAGTVAVSVDPFEELVIPTSVSGAPFKFTTELFENPVP
jgi:hypothetical protein